MISKWAKAALLGLALSTLSIPIAEASGTLTIGRREDSTTFDPIATAQNVDFWVFANVFDVLVRVDKTGQKLLPGIAESWEVSPDNLTYTFRLRDAKFSDGTPVTSEDAAYSLARIRDSKLSLWSDSYKIIQRHEDARSKDAGDHVERPLGSLPFHAGDARRLDRVQGRHREDRRRGLRRKAGGLRRLHGRGMAPRRPRHPQEEPQLLGSGQGQPRWRRVDLGAGRQHAHAGGAGRADGRGNLRAVLARRRAEEGCRTSMWWSILPPAKTICC